MTDQQLRRIVSHFEIDGAYLEFEEMCSGNINNSYRVTFRQAQGLQHYTLQHINHYVFQDPRGVMRNIDRVTGHLRKSLERAGVNPDRRVLTIVHTRTGGVLHEDEEGGFWRAFYYIDGATAYDAVEKPQHFYEAGRAFGEFQKLLCDFPAEQLSDTIPGFHDTPRRYQVFEQAVAQDKAGRVARLGEEIAFFRARQQMMGEIVSRLASGQLPLRVTHNDTKINNVLIDDATDRAICVIDLDTVMPGSALYDYGDAIRFGASTAAEDEPDLSKIALDLGRYELFTRGFLSQVNGFLTPEEVRLLPLGIQVITCELGMRFLTDYIDGDLYFKVNAPEHNLVRACAQMQLLRDVEAKLPQMQQMIEQMVK